jgi:hypothetical protein
LRGDTSSYPKPVWTLMGSVFFFTLFTVFPRLVRWVRYLKFQKLFFFSSAVFALIFLFLIQITLVKRKYNGIDQLVVFSRRLWICLTLAALAFAMFVHFKESWRLKKHTENLTSEFLTQRSLLLISLAAESQIYPLFDEMHFWWGSMPGVLILTQVLRSRIVNPLVSFGFKKIVFTFCVLGIGIISLLPMYNNINEKRVHFSTTISKHLVTVDEVAKNESALQGFFQKNLRKGESILNLCSNSNVFFVPNQFHSSTRLFVYWYPFELVPQYIMEYRNSQESAIVTCSINQVAVLAKKTEESKIAIISRKFQHPVLVASYQDSQGAIWNIFRNSGV